MTTLVSNLVVLLLVAIIAITVLSILGIISPEEIIRSKFKKEDGVSRHSYNNGARARNCETQVMSTWEMVISCGKKKLNTYGLKTNDIDPSGSRELEIATMGREDCDILIPREYDEVSRAHAVMSMKGDELSIKDVSTNGIFTSKDRRFRKKKISIQDGTKVYLPNNLVLTFRDKRKSDEGSFTENEVPNNPNTRVFLKN